MNVTPMTLGQFLAWEERQELRYEFDGFGPVAMAGGTRLREHSFLIARQLTDMLLILTQWR